MVDTNTSPQANQAPIKAEIVENIPVKQPTGGISATAGQSTDGVQPKLEAKKVVDIPKPTPKNLQPPKPPKAKPRPLLAVTTAGLVAAALAVVAFFAFRQS